MLRVKTFNFLQIYTFTSYIFKYSSYLFLKLLTDEASLTSHGRSFHISTTRLVKKYFRISRRVFSGTKWLFERCLVSLVWRSLTKEISSSQSTSLNPFKYLNNSNISPRARRDSSDWMFNLVSFCSLVSPPSSLIIQRHRFCTFSSASTSALLCGFHAGTADSRRGRMFRVLRPRKITTLIFRFVLYVYPHPLSIAN